MRKNKTMKKWDKKLVGVILLTSEGNMYDGDLASIL